MSKKKFIIAAVVLAGLGSALAVTAQARRGWHHGDHGDGPNRGMGLGMGDGLGGGDAERQGRGMLGGRSLSQDDYDARTRERFARLDKNSDGVIDRAEVEAALAEGAQRRGARWGKGGGDANPGQRMLQRFDSNKDGKVSKDEFLANATKRFADMDLNNDGKITDEDLPPMMRGRGVLTGEAPMGRGGFGGNLPPWFRDLASKDGVITREAALAAATKEFDRLDRNKDGVVDQADFDLMRKDMTEYRIQRVLHSYGADADGKVTREKFFAKAKERFAELDVNGDGRLDAADRGDRPGMRQRMGDRMRGWPGRERGQDSMGGERGERGPGGPGGERGPGAAPKQ